jgi:protein tyrosine phosphatase
MFSLMYLPILKMSQMLLMVFFIPYPLFTNIFLQLNRSQKLELTVNPISKQALMFRIVNQRSQAIKMAQRLTQFILMFISTTTNLYDSKSTMENLCTSFFP